MAAPRLSGWQKMAADLEEEAPDFSEHSWPEGNSADEHPDPRFDSFRGYVDQIDIYKRFQGKSIEDGRHAGERSPPDGCARARRAGWSPRAADR